MPMTSEIRTIACVITASPYVNRRIRDALDVIMASAAMERPPALFFVGSGVTTLVKNQEAKTIHQKNIASMMKALSLFDVNQIRVCQDSMQVFGFSSDDLLLQVELYAQHQMAELLNTYDNVLTF